MANQYSSPVNQIPKVPTPDGQSGALSTMRQAAFISAFVVGPARSQPLPGLTQLRVRETYQNFDLVPTAGVFRLEPVLGARKITGTVTRYQPRGQTIKAAIRAAYAYPNGKDVRLDMMPVLFVVNYTLVSPSYNYGAPLAQALWQYAEVYFNDTDSGFVENPNGLSTETLTFLGQAEDYTEGDTHLVTAPYPAGLYAKIS